MTEPSAPGTDAGPAQLPAPPAAVARPGRRRAPRVPAGRYGPPPSRGRRIALRIAVGLLAAALTGFLVWIALRVATPEVRAVELGYQVLSDRQVEVRFEVFKPAGVRALCIVRARNRAGAETGRAQVPVGTAGDDDERVKVAYRLPTRNRAITGEVPSCTLDGASG
ncbi:MAG: DUF4307 domain-containing protein [Actinomycetota bacterium]|nr:DUF4307 domain-containing protein [Actinomycetota bacterium]